MSDRKKRTKTNRTVVTLAVIGILVMCTIFYGCYQYYEDFTYTFYNTQVKFPITVGQAIEKYKVIPHQYNNTGKPYDSPCPPNVQTNSISEIFYVDTADDYIKPPSDSLLKNVYALKFCFTGQNKYKFQKMKQQLEKDFHGSFELKRNEDTKESYYQLDASLNVKIIIEFYPEFKYITDKTKTQDYHSWAVSFCYNLFGPDIHHYTKYERVYDAQ